MRTEAGLSLVTLLLTSRAYGTCWSVRGIFFAIWCCASFSSSVYFVTYTLRPCHKNKNCSGR